MKSLHNTTLGKARTVIVIVIVTMLVMNWMADGMFFSAYTFSYDGSWFLVLSFAVWLFLYVWFLWIPFHWILEIKNIILKIPLILVFIGLACFGVFFILMFVISIWAAVIGTLLNAF